MTKPIADGGCDHGYSLTACLWGREPEPVLTALTELVDLHGLRVLDAGCGEGRNAAYAARKHALVDATDVSELALRNAKQAWPDEPGVTWLHGDVLSLQAQPDSYDVVIFDSVAHWLPDETAVGETIATLQRVTRPGGWHVMCSFNSRVLEYENHVNPPRCLMAHEALVAQYLRAGWELLDVRDEEIISSHEDVPEPHRHSVTKVLARRPVDLK